jgi:hypothetical protein
MRSRRTTRPNARLRRRRRLTPCPASPNSTACSGRPWRARRAVRARAGRHCCCCQWRPAPRLAHSAPPHSRVRQSTRREWPCATRPVGYPRPPHARPGQRPAATSPAAASAAPEAARTPAQPLQSVATQRPMRQSCYARLAIAHLNLIRGCRARRRLGAHRRQDHRRPSKVVVCLVAATRRTVFSCMYRFGATPRVGARAHLSSTMSIVSTSVSMALAAARRCVAEVGGVVRPEKPFQAPLRKMRVGGFRRTSAERRLTCGPEVWRLLGLFTGLACAKCDGGTEGAGGW